MPAVSFRSDKLRTESEMKHREQNRKGKTSTALLTNRGQECGVQHEQNSIHGRLIGGIG